jgi:diacylglycerol O-acyltransferase
LVASYPVLPLSAGHLLAIGVTSYDGEVFFGLTADRDAISDLDVLAQCVLDALEELRDTTVRARSVRQPTRKAPAAARHAAAKKAAARQEAARQAAAQKRAAVRNLVSRTTDLGGGPALPPPEAAAEEPLAHEPMTDSPPEPEFPQSSATSEVAARSEGSASSSAPQRRTKP